ncbi:hypothetical protein [Streptomyces parvulus]|uniref:hypothetical protein n=1 Tax=Streptomyces parvulus TaxID=146923 RepID=UPI003675F69A
MPTQFPWGTACGRARRCVHRPTRWAPEVRGWVRHQLFDEHEIDDVVQQIFLAAWQSGITKHKINDAVFARTRRRDRHDRCTQRHGLDKAHDTFTDQLPGHLDSVRLLQLLYRPQRQVLHLALLARLHPVRDRGPSRHARGHRQRATLAAPSNTSATTREAAGPSSVKARRAEGPRVLARAALVRPVDEAVTAVGGTRLPDGKRHRSPAVLGLPA